MKPTSTPILFTLVVGLAAVLWLAPITSSLWLDALDTSFSARDGAFTAISRTLTAHPQCSLLYNALIALWMSVFGASEWVLRMPSILATALAAVFVFRIGARWVDRETGLLATLLFVGLHDVSFAATDARSYALATASGTAATFYLLRFVDTSSRRDGIAYALTAALANHIHYQFGLMLVPHALFVASALKRGELAAPRRDLLVVAATLAIAAAPVAIPLLATVVGDRIPSYAPPLNMFVLLAVWARPEIVVSVVPLAIFLLARGHTLGFALPRLSSSTWVLLVAWAVFAPAFIFFVSELATIKIFLARYYLCSEPGIALLLGIVLRGFEPAKLRMASATVYALISVLMYARVNHVQEDWRALTARLASEVGASTPVLLNAGFFEAAKADWLTLPADDDRRRFLLAPIEYYPMAGVVTLLPYTLTPETRSYVESAVVPQLDGVDRFACVWRQRRDAWVRPWFDARYTGAGFVARELWKSPALNAVIYERAPR